LQTLQTGVKEINGSWCGDQMKTVNAHREHAALFVHVTAGVHTASYSVFQKANTLHMYEL
jgi:hypothetical protein